MTLTGSGPESTRMQVESRDSERRGNEIILLWFAGSELLLWFAGSESAWPRLVLLSGVPSEGGEGLRKGAASTDSDNSEGGRSHDVSPVFKLR